MDTRNSTFLGLRPWIIVNAAVVGGSLLALHVIEATHNPPVASFSVDVDPTGAISGTTPQAYVADPNGDGSPADNSLTQGAVDGCINVSGPGAFTIDVVGTNMLDAPFYDVRLNFNPSQAAINTGSIAYTPFVDNLGNAVGFINLPFDGAISARRQAFGASNVDNVAGTAFLGATYIGPRTAADSADEPHAAVFEPARPYTAGPGGVPIVKLSVTLKAAAAGQVVTLDLANAPPLDNDYGSHDPATGQQEIIVVPESNLADGLIAVAPATCPAPPTPPPTLHDANIRLSGVPNNVRLSPGEVITDSASIVVANESDHTETIGVYVDATAPGGCTPNGRVLQTTVALVAGDKATIPVPVEYSCSNPSAADGLSYTWAAVADHGANDLSSCGASSLTGLACFNALADDDADPADNRKSRSGPRVIAQ
jgi:hypothetical protein